MSANCFQSLDVNRCQVALADLHELVGYAKGRIEVTRDGCDHVCVIISKAELESLERALQIFADTFEFQKMSRDITDIVAAAGGPSHTGDATLAGS